jgi:hypothetical protein
MTGKQRKQGDAFTKPTDGEDFDFDSWLNGAKLPERSRTVYGRADLVAELEELEEQLQAANQNAILDDRLAGSNTPQAIAARIAAVQEEMKSSALTFRFKALDKTVTKALYNEAPKIKDDDGDKIADQDWIAEHWIAKAAVHPKLTAEQVATLRERIGDGQFAGLWESAFLATNQKDVKVPFSVAASIANQDSSSS